MGHVQQDPLTRKDVVLIVQSDFHRVEMGQKLEALKISEISAKSLNHAYRRVKKAELTARILCLSTDGMNKVLSHDADRLIETTEPLRHLLGNPPMIVIGPCNESNSLREGGVIKKVTGSHTGAVETIVELLKELDHA